MLKENKWVIGLIAGGLLSMLGILIGEFIDNDITSEILSEDFLKFVKIQVLAGILQTCCGFSLVFWLVALWNASYGYHNDYSEKVRHNIMGAVLLASVFLGMGLIRAVPIMTHKAEARVGTVIDTRTSGGKVRNYSVVFEDGQEIGVTKKQYRSIICGDKLYTVYCGDTLIEIFDMEDYRLPGEKENEKKTELK